MHRAFHLERQYVATNLCPCNGCTQADNLKLKFVAHVGEVATQTIRQRRKLVGIDVILVHRLLKNPRRDPGVRAPLRGALPHRGTTPCPVPAQEVLQDLEGIGPARAYFVDVADLSDSMPPLPDPSVLARLGRTFAVAGAGMPYMLGLRRRRRATSPV